LLAALLLGAVAWVWARGLPQVCKDAVADSTVVRVCEPMSATDPRVLLFLLLVGLLLFPELSELELAGVLTLRRRLDEVRQEATELKSELAHIRTQATALSQATANSRNQIRVDVRQQQTGAALVEAGGGDDGVFDGDEEAGAYAQLAFEAGLAGLTRLLPQAEDDVSLVGYTVGDDGHLEATYFTGEVNEEDLNRLTALVNRPQVPVTTVTALNDGFAAFSFATVNGVVVGALAVRVPDGQVPDNAALEALGAGAEVAAGTYARLLVDLLGEGTAHGAGARGPERGQ
jgi:hypothetical protein